jgi:hypothetical protein
MAAQKKKNASKSTSSTTAKSTSTRTPWGEGYDVWTKYAKQTGDTFGEYLRRFGEEQQKNYERWVSTLRDGSAPTRSEQAREEMKARMEQWNKVSREIADRVTEAFLSSLGPQRETFETWMRPFLPKEGSSEERSRQFTELVTKFWTGMFSDVNRRFVEGLQPSKSVAEFTQLQENALKEFGETYQKLAYAYFSSPAFVGLFGKTLDNSLDLQKAYEEGEAVISRVTGLPTRREITELNEGIRELLHKVDRLDHED